MNPAMNQPHSPCIVGTSTLPSRSSSHNEYYQYDYQSFDQPSTNKWKSWHQWKDYPKPQYRTHPSGWIDYPKASSKHHSYYDVLQVFHQTTHCILLRPFTSTSTQIRLNPISCLYQCRSSGHVAINLQDGSRDEWARHIKHALNHPDRMRAANELKAEERPQPTTSPFNKMNTMLRWNSSIRSIPEFQVMYFERLSNCSSAPTSVRTTTFPLATSVNFLIPTCLHSLCHYQKSVDSRCRLLLTNNTITPGHSVTARPSKQLN